MADLPKMKSVVSEGLKAGMARPAARMTDFAGHVPATPGIVFGVPTVIIGGQIAARMGDPIKCEIHGAGNITMGSITVLIGGACAARMGDPTACCAPGVAGQGAPPVVGGPGSFDAPSHTVEGYDNEGGAKRTDTVSGGKYNGPKIEFFGIQFQNTDEAFSGKTDGHYRNDGGGAGVSAEGAAHTHTTTVQTKDNRDPKLKVTTKEGTGSAGVDLLYGKKDGKTGIGAGFSAQVAAQEEQLDIDEGEVPIPFTDWSIRRNATLGTSQGSIGQAANAGAYHDEADDRYHLNGMLDVKALKGLKLGLDFSIGKRGSATSGSPGAGGPGLAGTIASGCMTVLIGG